MVRCHACRDFIPIVAVEQSALEGRCVGGIGPIGVAGAISLVLRLKAGSDGRLVDSLSTNGTFSNPTFSMAVATRRSRFLSQTRHCNEEQLTAGPSR